MNLRADNPYSLGSLFTFRNGEVALDHPELYYEPSSADRYFTVVQGDDLWSIAFEAYGNSKYYWVIQLINDIELASDIKVGQSLVIPDLTKLDLL